MNFFLIQFENVGIFEKHDLKKLEQFEFLRKKIVGNRKWSIKIQICHQFFGDIDVGDGCRWRNVLMTNSRCLLQHLEWCYQDRNSDINIQRLSPTLSPQHHDSWCLQHHYHYIGDWNIKKMVYWNSIDLISNVWRYKILRN